MDIALVTSLVIGSLIVGAILLMDWARRRENSCSTLLLEQCTNRDADCKAHTDEREASP